MSNLLACQMPDVFRAIGVMAGSLNGSNCGTHPIASWAEHGDADTTVNISGGIRARDLFIQHNGCDTTNTQTAAMPDGKTTCTIYNSCTSGKYPVVWCPIPGQGHQIASWAGAGASWSFEREMIKRTKARRATRDGAPNVRRTAKSIPDIGRQPNRIEDMP